ncbi:MAG: hypothetical protein IT370_35500 [Deltaproteobacteria bacterium]|nr:hypothetical protein [Deltaproteobacteria bacterium]
MSTLLRVAGCDLGKAQAKLLVARVGPGGLELESSVVVPHQGRALEVFADWYRREHIERCAALGATGLAGGALIAPVLAGLPEDACLQATLRLLPPGPLRVVSVGARGYAVLARDAAGRHRFLESDKCSSGTGETMVRLAARFGLGIEEADRLALAASDAIGITARCSVFAKSELTHYANQGRPADHLLRGYFESVARYVLALASRAGGGPLWLAGGVSRSATFMRALAAAADVPVAVAPHALELEAIGAATLAAEQARAGTRPLPAEPEALLGPRRGRIAALAPARRAADRVRIMPAPEVAPQAALEPCLLGLDLGSTGAKAVLISLATGEIVEDLYDRTRGNPAEATGRLLRGLEAGGRRDVRAIGVTGSGREAVATVLRAVYPAAAERLVVENEIVAHATAAVRCDERAGASLSVIEIGGQDAKFIQIRAGQIVESDLNKACSAGTGSFLEEQAVLHGVDDIARFSELAEAGATPPDLGQMCTVFVAETAGEARADGYATADLFAGFQYAVVHNYLHRVMGARTLGERVFFQGKPASSRSLAWTLAEVTGREVIVPPNPGAMGAWGIALVARDRLPGLAQAPAFALAAFLDATVVARSEFQCKDPGCLTLCHIDRTTVAIGAARETVLTGGACAKYELSSISRKLPREAPSPFDEREALLEPLMAGGDGPDVVAVPDVVASTAVAPFLVHFLRGLGLSAKLVRSDARALARGEERCLSYDTCAPVKLAHAVADSKHTRILLPKIRDLPDRDGPGGRTCPQEQGLADVLAAALAARGVRTQVVRPVLELGAGLDGPGVRTALAGAARELGVDPARVPAALALAVAAQRSFEAALAAIGARALAWSRAQRAPCVIVCGPLHVIHERAINAGIPALLRQNGALALPMDCLPLPAGIPELPRAVWRDSVRALRVVVAARAQGAIYPLLLSSFGCGPASFTEHAFEALAEGYPHTILESDGHGGSAGFVTRIQAFLHTVACHDGLPAPTPAQRLALLAPKLEPPLADERGKQLVVFPLGDRLGPTLAAAFRGAGHDAVATRAGSPATLAAGRRDCSGKECLPYQLIWGAFRDHLERQPTPRQTVLLQVSGQGPCRNCMFSVKDALALERADLSSRVQVRHVRPDPDVPTLPARMFAGAVAWDILNQLRAYHRALEPRAGQADALYSGACDRLEELLARPARGPGAALRQLGDLAALRDLIDDSARSFAALGRAGAANDNLRTVLLSGDIYLRLDEFASDQLPRRLAERGLRVLIEPLTTLLEYTALVRSPDLLQLPTAPWPNRIFRVTMALLRRLLYRRARRHPPWLPRPDAAAAAELAEPFLAGAPQGEAPITVGSVLHGWRQRSFDGVVLTSPWGCGPALVSESLLRHQRDIPMLFLYHDGSPIDERRLNGFAFHLRRSAARTRH